MLPKPLVVGWWLMASCGLAAPGYAQVTASAASNAGVVVELAQGPAGVVSPLEPGDLLLARQPVGGGGPARRFAHWVELDVLAWIEVPRGALEIELERAGTRRREQLNDAAWTLRGRPVAASEELVAWVLALAAAPPATDLAEVTRRAAGLDDDSASWLLARFAEAAGKRGSWTVAADAYAAAIARSSPLGAAHLERSLGEALRRARRYPEAEQAFARALAGWEAIEPDGLGSSTVLGALGNLQAERFQLAQAQQSQARALAIRVRLAAGSWLHAAALSNLATVAGRRNDLATADRLLGEALALAEAKGGEVATVLANLGTVHRLRGDFERAEMYTRRAISAFRVVGNHREVVGKLINLANVQGDTGRSDVALATTAEALALLAEKAPDRDLLGFVHGNRARLYQDRGDHAAAEVELAAARAVLAFVVPRTDTEAMVTSLYAAQARQQGDLPAAAQWAELTLAARERLQPDSALEAQAASELAKIRVDQGRLTEADALFRRSLGALERQQERLGGGDRGLVAFRAKYAVLYRNYLEFLLRQGRHDEAFAVYERSRARALLALLRQRDLDYPAADLDPELGRRRLEVTEAIDRAYLAMARLGDDAAAAGQRAEQRQALEALHAQRERLDAELRAGSPRLAAAEAPPALAAGEIARRLPAGTLLLAYSVGDAESHLFALDAGRGLTVQTLGVGRRELGAAVDRWRELVAETSLRRAELALLEARLGGWLLAPVAGRLVVAERLVIIADDALHGLAFAALPHPGAQARRLVEALPIAHQVSASVHVELAARVRGGEARGVAVFADPVTSGEATAQLRRELGRLPATRREAARLAALFAPAVRTYIDAAATESAARRELASVDLVHFATHAVVDPALPLDSAIVLSPEPGQGEVAAGGLLQAWEIAEQLAVQAELVVLSACDTALGGDRGGEGLLGLVRALQVAGAPNVLASLWRVDDESTAELMARFHGHLARGQRRDEALRAAQLDLLRGGIRVQRGDGEVALATTEPRHWAAFVLVGGG
jgi:CHAT domain-containing protein